MAADYMYAIIEGRYTDRRIIVVEPVVGLCSEPYRLVQTGLTYEQATALLQVMGDGDG